MLRLPSPIGKTLVLLLSFIAVANMGCAKSIAAKFPHLERRSDCVLPAEIERDSTEYVFTENNVPISNFHPEIVERVAPNARTVYEYDPDAGPDNTRKDLPLNWERGELKAHAVD